MFRIPILTSCFDVLHGFRPRIHALRTERPASVGVVISTYNNPEWLRKTLWGYAEQKFDRCPLEFLIADDGSSGETREVVDAFREETGWNVQHIWQPNQGFRKWRIANRALLAARSEYLIFTDQDCVPRSDFIETHYRLAQRGFFLSGRYARLPLELSRQLTREDVASGRAFRLKWLKERGFRPKGRVLQLVENRRLAAVLNVFTPTQATWNGMDSSGWRDDLLAVNGFENDFGHGGGDVEMGSRLINLGLRAKQVRYSIVCLHLDHARGYVHLEERMKIRRQIRENRVTGKTLASSGVMECEKKCPKE